MNQPTRLSAASQLSRTAEIRPAFLTLCIAFILAGAAGYVIALVVLVPEQPLRIFAPASMALIALLA